MDVETAAFCCICGDLLKLLNYQDHFQCRMSTAEVMTAALTAAAFFGGNHEKSRNFLKEYRYVPRMISKSRFSRRLAGIPEFVWRGLACLGCSRGRFIENLCCRQLSCLCLPEHPHETLQNLQRRNVSEKEKLKKKARRLC